jgi:tetratricopeptide (TPR) repeat protein
MFRKLDAKNSINIDKRTVQLALRNIRRLDLLAKCSLVDLKIVDAEAGSKKSNLDRARVLQKLLISAIDTLKPSFTNTTDLSDKQFRAYLVLSGKYIEKSSTQQITTRMAIQRSTFFSEQSQAIDQLVDVLRDWENQTKLSELGISNEIRLQTATAKSAIGLLGELAVLSSNFGESKYAESALNQELEIATQLNAQRATYESIAGLGILQYWHGDSIKGEGYIKEALALAEKSHDPIAMSNLKAFLGFTKISQGKYEQAIALAHDCLENAPNTATCEGIGTAWMTLGIVAHHRGDFELAELHLRSGIYASKNIRRFDIAVPILINLADLMLDRGDLTTAYELLDEANKMIQHTHYFIAQSSLLACRGKAQWLKFGELAERDFLAAIEEAKRAECPWFSCYVDLRYGEVLLELNRLADAQSAFSEAFQISSKLNAITDKGLALCGLAKTYQLIGDSVKALELGQMSLRILQPLQHFKSKEVSQWFEMSKN